MKRKDIVAKLMKEGLSEKLLARMSDQMINTLAERMISEQLPPTIPNVSKTDVQTITSLKQQKKPFATYEGDIKEDEEDKENVIKRLKHKIEHCKDKGKVTDAKKALAQLTKKKEVDEGEFKSKTEWLKSKGIIKDDDDKEETTESSEVAEPEPEKKKDKSEKKEKGTKGGGGAEYEKRLAKGNLGFGLNEWVNNVVGKNVHPFTSKNEIMELIQAKLTEQTDVEVDTLPDFLTGDAIMSASPQTAEPTTKPTTKPGTKPTTRPTPKTPFQPGPGPKHNPKAGAKI